MNCFQGVELLSGLVMCIVSKMLLIRAIVALYLLWNIIAKQRLWLSLIGSLMSSVLLFMVIPMLTPLDSGITNVLICGAVAAVLGIGLGTISNTVMKKLSCIKSSDPSYIKTGLQGNYPCKPVDFYVLLFN